MRWLHRLLRDRQQLLAEGVDIDLLAHGHAKRLDRFARIVLRAEETAIYRPVSSVLLADGAF